MSVPPPPRSSATRPTSNIRPAGIGASYALNPTPQGRAAGYIPVAPLGHVEVIANAPTLGQFWRSDIRRTTGGRRPRWAGLTAFWVGLAAIGFLVIGTVIGIGVLAAIALPLSTVALFFAIIALIAGVGRVLGFFGLLFALIGNIVVVDWFLHLFG
jgi:hypothetical protein